MKDQPTLWSPPRPIVEYPPTALFDPLAESIPLPLSNLRPGDNFNAAAQVLNVKSRIGGWPQDQTWAEYWREQTRLIDLKLEAEAAGWEVI